MIKTYSELLEAVGSFKSKIQREHLLIAAIFLLTPLVLFLAKFIPGARIATQIIYTQEKNNLFDTLHAPDQVIVQYKDAYTYDEIINLKSKLEALGVLSQEKLFNSEDPTLRNFYIVKFIQGTDLKKVVRELSGLPEIEDIGLNYLFQLQESPNDPYYTQMWNLAKIDMSSAWNLAKGSSSVKVAVIDTGVDYTHPDLQGRIIKGNDYSTCNEYNQETGDCLSAKKTDDDPMDDKGHGTHVAGTIGALTNNGIGVAGINWNVQILAVKAIGASGNGMSNEISEAIVYAVDHGANIINLSLITEEPCSVAVGYKEAIQYANDKNVLVVSAAGNNDKDSTNQSPPSCAGVLTVGATDQNDARSHFKAPKASNWGAEVDIAAPGSAIYSTWINNQYFSNFGTSMAAPHVAGVAALLWSINPNLSVNQVRNCLIQNGDPISTDKPIGGKRLNAFKTLNACSGLPPVTPNTSPTPTPETPLQATATPIVIKPTVTAKKTPMPTPRKTYTCREQTGKPPTGAIQIGNLICIENK